MVDELANSIIKLVTHQIAKRCLREATKNERMPVGFYKSCRSKGIYLNTRYRNLFEIPAIEDKDMPKLKWDQIDRNLLIKAEAAGLINTAIFCEELVKDGGAYWTYKNQAISSNEELWAILVNLGVISSKYCYPCKRTLPECGECKGNELSGNSRQLNSSEIPNSSGAQE